MTVNLFDKKTICTILIIFINSAIIDQSSSSIFDIDMCSMRIFEKFIFDAHPSIVVFVKLHSRNKLYIEWK